MTLHAPALAPATFARVASHRPSRRRHRRRWPWQTTAAERRRLFECLLLAAAIHLLLVLWIGNAPGGSAQPGQGVGGRLNVVLRIDDYPRDATRSSARAPPAAAISPPAPTPGRGADLRGPNAARAQESRPEVRVAPPPLQPEPSPQRVPRIAPTEAPAESGAPPPQTALPAPAAPPPLLSPPAPTAEAEIAPALAADSPPAPPSVVTLPAPATPRQAPIESDIPAPATTPPPATVRPPELKAADIALPAPPAITLPPVVPVGPAAAAPAAAPTSEAPAASLDSRPPAMLGAPPGRAEATPPRGSDVATSSEPPASAPAPLNLQLPRGGELSGRTTPGLLPLLPRPPERPSKLATDIENAAKPDCRTAYSGMGLLATAPLAANAVTGSGCRW